MKPILKVAKRGSKIVSLLGRTGWRDFERRKAGLPQWNKKNAKITKFSCDDAIIKDRQDGASIMAI